jgi:hypothetical protein
MEKILGKNKEFILLNKFSEKKETYTRYFYNCKCINCKSERVLSQSDKNSAICLECRKRKTIDNVLGKKINIYEVLEFSYNKKNSNFYECKCLNCDSISVVKINLIKTNKSCKNCRQYGSEPTEQSQIKYKFDQYKRGAKERNLIFELSEKDFKKITIKNCFYCNGEPKPRKYYNSKNLNKTISLNGIDRIDSNFGYILKNCIPCCEMCNKMKMAYKQSDFLEQIKKIYNNLLIN